jgi:serine/threonine protein kinase HipA of HipAB toxin-antitoxin module
VSDQVKVPEEENKVDLSLLPEKEKNKILNQRTRDAKKAVDRALREATRATAKAMREATAAAEKEAKKAEKSGKSKAFTSPLFLTETSTTSPSQNPHKRDSSFAQLSMSRLQQLTLPSFMDSVGGTLHIQEFFFSGSLLSTDAYIM